MRASNERGAVLVELALVVLTAAALGLAAFDFNVIFDRQTAMTRLSRDAAITVRQDCSSFGGAEMTSCLESARSKLLQLAAVSMPYLDVTDGSGNGSFTLAVIKSAAGGPAVVEHFPLNDPFTDDLSANPDLLDYLNARGTVVVARITYRYPWVTPGASLIGLTTPGPAGNTIKLHEETVL